MYHPPERQNKQPHLISNSIWTTSHLHCLIHLHFSCVAACSECARSCNDAESRTSCSEHHDSGQGPTLCPILENGSSGESLITPAYILQWGGKHLGISCILTHFFFFFLLQGVPVQAIRNKMVMEGLDPNLLEWVFFFIFLLLLFCFYPNTSAFLLFISNWPIIIPSLLIIAHQMPLCLMEKLGAQRTKMLMLTVLTVNLLSVTDISTLLSSP